TPVAFSVLITISCGPSAAGSSEALTLALNSPPPTRKVRPLLLTVVRCGPRITQETSCPASASRTAKWLPTAPAPKTHIRIELISCRGRIEAVRRQFPQACAAAQPVMPGGRPAREPSHPAGVDRACRGFVAHDW